MDGKSHANMNHHAGANTVDALPMMDMDDISVDDGEVESFSADSEEDITPEPSLTPEPSRIHTRAINSVVVDPEWDHVVTIMMGNVPSMCTLPEMLAEIQGAGFRPYVDFDFLHLPVKVDTGKAMGCCFMNFTSPQLTLRFKSIFEGRHMKLHQTGKALALCPAKYQGYDANYRHHIAKHDTKAPKSARPLFLDAKNQNCPSCDANQSCEYKFCIFCGTALPGQPSLNF